MWLYDGFGLLALLALGFTLVGVARGVIPRPGPMALRGVLVACAVMAGLSGSEPESLLGGALVVVAVGTQWVAGLPGIAGHGRFARVMGLTAASACLVLGLLALSGLLNTRDVLNRPELPGGPLYDETLEQVRTGMSREQVEAVVGPPRDAWRGRRASAYAFTYQQRGYESWIGRDTELLVLFDERDHTVDVQRVPTVSTHPPTWASRIAERLGL